jgi:hypothetical protein
MANKKRAPAGTEALRGDAESESKSTLNRTGGKAPNNECLAAALAYAAVGLKVFPVDTRHNKPLPPRDKDEHGQPIPGTGGWKKATDDRDTIKQWWKIWPSAGVGIRTGSESGISVLDLDKKKGKNGLAQVPHWATLTPVIAETKSDGRHLYFRYPEWGAMKSDEIIPGVEIKCENACITAPPTPGYKWVNGLPDFKTLPEWPSDYEILESGRSFSVAQERPTETTPNAEAEADPRRVAAALEVIPNNDLEWNDWVRIGMATWAATGGSEQGFEAFDQWSAKSEEKYNKDNTRKKWDEISRSPPNSIGAGTLFHEAWKVDREWEAAWLTKQLYDRAHERQLDENGFCENSISTDETKPVEPPKPQATKSKAKPLPTFKHGEVRAEALRWLVRNRVPETGAGLLLGQWSAYKTFLALDLSAHVMLGWPWTGEPVYRQGGVLLLAPEGADSIAMRLAALVENKIAPRANELPSSIDPKRLPFEWTNYCPMLLGRNPLPTLVATAEAATERFQREYQLPLSLIWIDTMATAAGWKDENDNAEASRAMAVLRDLSSESGAVVMGIDHLGKNIEAGARGASAKEANTDFLLTSTGEELGLRKLREGPQGVTIPFAARVVDMGKDEYGYPVTSIVIDWNVAPRRKEKTYSAIEELLAKSLSDVLAAKGEMIDGVKMVRREDVRAAFRAAYKPDQELNDGARDERFRKALASHDRIERKKVEGTEYLAWRERDM